MYVSNHKTDDISNKTEGNEPIRILVIAGPTAAGKSAFALKAAARYQGEIVSCDCMQLYRHLDIGSAKPTPEERALVPHHLVDCIDPGESEGTFTAARYAQMAAEAIREIHARGHLPIICGGTGLYLNALLYNMDFGAPPADPDYREKLEKIAEEKGSAVLHDMLKAADPDAADRIHPNNAKKIIRALERLEGGESSVRPFQEVQQENPAYDPLLVCLTRDRQELYDRINRRVLQMMDQGLEDEVRGLIDMGLTDRHIAMLGIGYKEMLPYLAGECSREEALETIQKNTRHLAKRQLTWFRRYDTMIWFDISDFPNEEAAEEGFLKWLDQNL